MALEHIQSLAPSGALMPTPATDMRRKARQIAEGVAKVGSGRAMLVENTDREPAAPEPRQTASPQSSRTLADVVRSQHGGAASMPQRATPVRESVAEPVRGGASLAARVLAGMKRR